MNQKSIENNLKNPARFFIEHLNSVDSTNSYLNEKGKSGAPEWTVVVAEQQTGGRGRYQRQWESPPESGLWFSLLLRPQITTRYLNLINLFTAWTLSQYLEKTILAVKRQRIDIALKWPNDLLIDSRKISGILLEGSFSAEQLQYIVVGIGLNVNQNYSDFPEELQDKAGSLRTATGLLWSRSELLAGYLDFYFDNYQHYFPDNPSAIVDLYQDKVAMSGREITVKNENVALTGTFSGLTPEGYLILQHNGALRIITAGDIFGN